MQLTENRDSSPLLLLGRKWLSISSGRLCGSNSSKINSSRPVRATGVRLLSPLSEHYFLKESAEYNNSYNIICHNYNMQQEIPSQQVADTCFNGVIVALECILGRFQKPHLLCTHSIRHFMTLAPAVDRQGYLMSSPPLSHCSLPGPLSRKAAWWSNTACPGHVDLPESRPSWGQPPQTPAPWPPSWCGASWGVGLAPAPTDTSTSLSLFS